MAKPVHSRYIQLTKDTRVHVSQKIFKEVEHLIMPGTRPGFWFPKRGEKDNVRYGLKKLAEKFPEHFTRRSLDTFGI
jgi:hypothetical protein